MEGISPYHTPGFGHKRFTGTVFFYKFQIAMPVLVDPYVAHLRPDPNHFGKSVVKHSFYKAVQFIQRDSLIVHFFFFEASLT